MYYACYNKPYNYDNYSIMVLIIMRVCILFIIRLDYIIPIKVYH